MLPSVSCEWTRKAKSVWAPSEADEVDGTVDEESANDDLSLLVLSMPEIIMVTVLELDSAATVL